jgi:SAM-dependent methyltransferase
VRQLVQRLNWDARFRAGDHAGSTPDPFLLSVSDCLALLPSGAAALDLACGAGRHAVWLAERGFQVTAIDFSAEALALTGRRSSAVRCLQLDLEASDIDLGRDAYDLICGFFFLHRPLFPALRAALRPGGLLIYKTYTTDQLRYPGRPRHPMHLLEPNELLRLVEGFRVLRYEEVWEGKGTAAVAAQRADRKRG